MKIPFDSTC